MLLVTASQRYVSTRGGTPAGGLPFSDILVEGLAADGGLYLPAAYPELDAATLARWRTVLADDGYAALAFEVLSLFIDDIDPDDLRGICARAYAPAKFSGDDVVPVTSLTGSYDGLRIAHLSTGPTAAFKDLAMQLLGELFEYELARRDDRITILGATSGDTGSAAEYAMRGKDRVQVFMLSPRGRMTPFQQAQMYAIDDPHIVNITVDGSFDDCQDLVKAVNADAAFKAAHHVGAVNSINWARLVAQVAYYVSTWLRSTSGDDEVIGVAVPSGNFGNICAAHVAREMGIGLDPLVLATNENNVLEEFFTAGVYRVRTGAETLATSSPSMDISKASNVERFIADLLGRDGARVGDLFGRVLPAEGAFDLSGTPQFATLRERYGFVAGHSTHADRLATIGDLYTETGVLIDPHTADGLHVALAHRHETSGPLVVMETALPVKFADTITEALGIEPEVPARFASLLGAERHTVELHGGVDELKDLIAAG